MKFKFEWVCPCLGEWQLWVDKYHIGTIFATEDDDKFIVMRGNGRRCLSHEVRPISFQAVRVLLEQHYISDVEVSP